MGLRHPPKGYVPPVAKKRGGGRVVKFAEPEVGFFRRWLRRLTRPAVLLPVAFLTAAVLGVFGYYYHEFSKRIDSRLRGEVFTRSAGIYAAPRQLRAGETLAVEDLVARLKRAGYVERAQQADDSRGRYAVSGATVEIEPSKDSVIDGTRQFPRLRAQFERGGKRVAALTNLDGGARMQSAWLEPELISSATQGSSRDKEGGGQSQGPDKPPERIKRKVIGFADIPEHLRKAIITTEDRTFFEHRGINFRGILRALVRRYDADPNSPIARQGGSSITQQLVKNLWLSPEYSYRRKAAEAYMSLIIETRLSKEEIFALYCNEAYLGQRAGFSIKGFGEASEAYFNKDITALSLPESALLAALTRSPNRYNPYRHPQVAFERRNQVLKDMAATGAITEVEAAQAMATELKVAPQKGRIDVSEAPYFVDFAQQQLSEMLEDTSAAERLRIYTTVDMDLQRAAYAAVVKQLAALDKVQARRFPPGTVQAALVAMKADTGEVVAMVGGRDYEKSQLNRATDAMRQPGSVFKPFVYAAALNTAFDPIPRVITAATTYKDAPKPFYTNGQEYTPGNFGELYSNKEVTVRDALVKSLNVVTVEIAQDVTIGRVNNLAERAGLPKPKQNYLAHALGTNEAKPIQVASAYTAFAQEGRRAEPVVINRITTGGGRTITDSKPKREEVMRPEVAYVMTSMMKDVINRGTAAKVRARGFKANVAGKTGTSRDGWFAGYTPNLVCVVYVGFDDGSQLGMTGADSALPIWTDFMTAALQAHPEWGGEWQMPSGVEEVEIDAETGALPTETTVLRRKELFIAGTAPEAPAAEETEETDAEGETVEDPNATPQPTPGALEVPPLPDETSPPSSRTRTAPADDGRGAKQERDSSRLVGTVTLDIDPTTGLIAADTCPVIRPKTFALGTEPRRRCGPQYHTGRDIIPSETRPRRVSP